MFLLTLLSGLAFADEPKFENTQKEVKKLEKPEAHLTAEFGGALTTGNSEFYMLTAGLNASYKWQRSKIGLIGGAVVGSSRVDSDGNSTLSDEERAAPMVPSAKRFFGDLRYDFFLSDRDSVYILLGAFHDPFAGYDLRTHEQIGYSRVLIKSDSTSLVGEIGIDFAQENYKVGDDGVDPETKNIIAGRVMVGITHKFSEGVGFEDTFELYEAVPEFADLRMLNTASIVAALGSKLSLKLSHSFIFDNVPVEGFQKFDQTMNITLVASIL